MRTLMECAAILSVCGCFSTSATALTPLNDGRSATKAVCQSGAECVMELNSRRILYEKDGDLRLPMASTTKILTAITVLEETDDIKKEISVPVEAVGVEGSSVYLQAGETYTVEDLLYGLMLRSGNDAATALAISCGENVKDFTAKMNYTAQKAGAIHSHFVNPHGLPCKDHYTTATDLNLIACYALHNETFAKIVATKFYEPRKWQNKNKLLHVYDGAIGVKTGYTKEAGRCLVSAAKRDGMTLVCTLLNCPQTYERTAQLFDDCFRSFEIEKILRADEIFSVKLGAKTYEAQTQEAFDYPLREEEKEYLERRIVPMRNEKKSPKKGEKIGQIEIYLLKRLLFSANLYKL